MTVEGSVQNDFGFCSRSSPERVRGVRRVAVLYTCPGARLDNAPSLVRAADDLTANAGAIQEALQSPRREVRCFRFQKALDVVSDLGDFQPDIVFNLAEGPLGSYEKEPHAVALLELLGLPYTGNGLLPLLLCKDKGLTKEVLQARGVPTPEFCVYTGARRRRPLPGFPLVVKPLRQDGSLGITEASVVRNRTELGRCVRQVAKNCYDDALVEEFMSGREIQIGILGHGTGAEPYRVLPASEYVYHSPRWQVCTFDAKWDENHPSYAAVEAVDPARLSARLERRLRELTLACARIFGLTGYGRVDFRLNGRGEPHVLEVNPNPDLSPRIGFARAAETAGLSYPALIEEILRLGVVQGAR